MEHAEHLLDRPVDARRTAGEHGVSERPVSASASAMIARLISASRSPTRYAYAMTNDARKERVRSRDPGGVAAAPLFMAVCTWTSSDVNNSSVAVTS